MKARARTILHLINTTGPGGAETVLANLARALDHAKWRSLAVVLDHGWLETELTTAGVRTWTLTDRGISALPRYALQLLRIASSNDVDLIHAHLLGPGYVASLLRVFTGIPVLVTIHGVPDFRGERLLALKSQLLRRASRVVFVSEPLRETFLSRQHIAPARTAVIPNGVDLSVYSPERADSSSAVRRTSSGTFVVGAIGNIRHAKAYDVLLHAAVRLKARYEGYRFVIVGDGTATPLGRELLHLRDALGLTAVVDFVGFRADVRPLLRTFDIYALTSRTEGFSISTLEAMAGGVPIVATRCGGPEQILEDDVTGRLVQNGSPEAIADAIDALRKDGDTRARLALAASRDVTARFSIDAQITAYERLYEDCLFPRQTVSDSLIPERGVAVARAKRHEVTQ